ncbi:MAG TPA: phosphate signaling complex protein PhoU [Bryobacteraceae bacterium]|jgi:phosphate transport system protein|nr:phosphate signaling complex protein PhoU [Bryobacteraceae bacterium]
MVQFELELEGLKERLRDMAALVASSIHKSVLCVTQRNEDFGQQVLRDEAIVNQMEMQIDEMTITLLTLQQPVARDMRMLIVALKTSTDLERMGDLAVNTVARALTLIHQPPTGVQVDIEAMASLVQDMVLRCLEAFTKEDADLARSVLTADDEVDKARNVIYDALTHAMERDPSIVKRGLSLLFIARNLERIADHATNIAEDVIFLRSGVDVRHRRELATEPVPAA